MDEVKKCPYCGEIPSIRLWGRNKQGELWIIECLSYYCNNPRFVVAIAKEEAIKFWNDYVSEIERKMNIDEKDSNKRH